MSQEQTTDFDEVQAAGIADRVRFWEEQDRINQELIPRVIRQNELLTRHIADHENLPLAAAEAARQAISQAQQAIEKQLEKAKSERDVMENNYRAALAKVDAQKRRTAFISVGASTVGTAIALVAIVLTILG